MLHRLLILTLLIASSLFAKIDMEVVQIIDGNSYILNDGDVVFEKSGLKFNFKTIQNENLKISYQYDNKTPAVLFNETLASNNLYSFPQDNQQLILDQESGVLKFTFETLAEKREFKLYANPNNIIESTDGKSPMLLSEQKRKYINATTLITNTRGDKESNIIIPRLEAATVIVNSANAIGAGIIVNKGEHILTNYHVVEDDENNIYIALKPKLGNSPSKANYFKAKVVKVDMIKDLALLELPVNILKNPEVVSLQLSDENSLKKGIDIYNMGHPLGYYYAFEKGIVNNILNDYKWTTHKADYVLQYSMNSNQGNSGGPVVNEKLELVGIGAFSNTEGKNLNFAISIIDIKQFLQAKESVRVEKKNMNDYTKDIVEKGLYKNARFAKLDRNHNGIPDAMLKDSDGDGIWDMIAYDTNEDGIYERVTSFK